MNITRNSGLGLVIVVVLIVLAVGGIAFYAGMHYGSARRPSTGFAPGGGTGFAARGGFGGGVAGQITALDNASITVTMRDGSTKTVTLPDGIGVVKTVDGGVSDLAVGEQVTVTGTTTADGTFEPSVIMIRPSNAPANASQ